MPPGGAWFRRRVVGRCNNTYYYSLWSEFPGSTDQCEFVFALRDERGASECKLGNKTVACARFLLVMVSQEVHKARWRSKRPASAIESDRSRETWLLGVNVPKQRTGLTGTLQHTPTATPRPKCIVCRMIRARNQDLRSSSHRTRRLCPMY